jgi:tRNA threonylcarbamoyladenosine biosynthesis protein TsaE
MELVTKSAQETRQVGKKFATSLIEGEKDKLTVALIGELGAGKTTFTQGFAEGLGIKSRVISPTFILMRRYEIPPMIDHSLRFTGFYHIDLYRIEEKALTEVKNIGIDDIWEKPGNIVFIEWAEKIADMIPRDAYEIKFEIIGEKERKIIINKNE